MTDLIIGGRDYGAGFRPESSNDIYKNWKQAGNKGLPDDPVTPAAETPYLNKGGMEGVQRGMSGGVGSALLSGAIGQGLGGAGLTAGVAGAGGAGLGLMLLEQQAQAEQAHEQAKMAEANQRKQNELSAINQAIAMSRGLSVGA